MLGVVVGALVLGVAMLGLAVLSAVASAGDLDLAFDDDGRGLREHVIEGKADSEHKVLVVPIRGAIMGRGDDLGVVGDTVARVRATLRKARKDKSIKVLLLDIDSPGGGVTASDIIHHELQRFRQETGLPMVALFGDVAASGGYYVAMAADEVMARRTTVTGSIGVVSRFMIWAELLQKVGVQVETIKSQRADGSVSVKDIGSPFRPMSAEERALMQGIVQQMWERFVEVVIEGRKKVLKPDEVRALADGRVFTGEQALGLKLVDRIGYRDDALKRALALANIEDARVVGYKRVTSLTDVFGELRGGMGGPDVLQRLQDFTRESPRLLYLWTGR